MTVGLTSSFLPSRCAATQRCRQSPCISSRSTSRRQIVTAQEKKQNITGYTEKDSAGQANIYPVMTKSYLAGSQSDPNNPANTAIPVVLGVLALAAVSIGLFLAKGDPSGSLQDAQAEVGVYKTLSEYKNKFASEQ